jgi:hypothetical protein
VTASRMSSSKRCTVASRPEAGSLWRWPPRLRANAARPAGCRPARVVQDGEQGLLLVGERLGSVLAAICQRALGHSESARKAPGAAQPECVQERETTEIVGRHGVTS